MNHDMTSKVEPRVALVAQEIVTDTTVVGPIIDSANFESADICVLSGEITDGDYTVAVFDGDDPGLSDEAPVNADFLINALPVYAASEDNIPKHFGLVTKKRFFRIKTTSLNVTSGGFFSATATMGDPRNAPTAAVGF